MTSTAVNLYIRFGANVHENDIKQKLELKQFSTLFCDTRHFML